MAEIAHKRCSKCKRSLPRGAFHKDKSTRDGLQGRCKKCRGSKREQACNSDQGIDSWYQVESVLRAMAEHDLVIEAETVKLQKAVKLLKRDYDEEVESFLLHRIHLEQQLKRFLLDVQPVHEPMDRKYKFGTISIRYGYITIKPNKAAAKARINKP